MARTYRQGRRAASVEDTRRRITEAAVHLHGTVGPARTTISAIAAHAGVERLTVYRHFADEAAICAACSSHWMAAHPPPDSGDWAGMTGADAVTTALTALYRYYGRTAEMWRLVHRDAPLVPAMHAPFRGWQAYLDGLRRGLVRACAPPSGRRGLVSAAIGHAVAFPTWDDLAGRGVTPRALVDLMTVLVLSAVADGGAQPQRPPRGAAAGS